MQADFRVSDPLRLSVAYAYQQRVKTANGRVNPVNNLSLNGTFSLFKDISIYARIDNLLNRTYEVLPLAPSYGINYVGGLTFSF
jgi:outer membrane receptor protein involved in Fe transport